MFTRTNRHNSDDPKAWVNLAQVETIEEIPRDEQGQRWQLTFASGRNIVVREYPGMLLMQANEFERDKRRETIFVTLPDKSGARPE
jgi:uncharacterized protein YlzI (FlbEa/FlbD family)